jgi:hypothetical protein
LLAALALTSLQPGRVWLRPLTVSALALATAILVVPKQTLVQSLRAGEGALPSIEIAGSTLWVGKKTQRMIAQVQQLDQQLSEGESLFFAPYYPGLYAVVGRRSPTWNLHYLLTPDASHQQHLLTELQAARVSAAITRDRAVDGREDLRFSRTHSEVWDYLEEHLQPAPLPGLPADTQLWRRPPKQTP